MSRGRQGVTCVQSRGQCFRKEEVFRWCLEGEKHEARINLRPSQGPRGHRRPGEDGPTSAAVWTAAAVNQRREVRFEPTGPRFGCGAGREASWLAAPASPSKPVLSAN